MRLVQCALLLLVLVAVLPPPVQADAAPVLPVGPTLQPTGETQVRMESERIEITLLRNAPPGGFSDRLAAEVRVLFHFVPAANETLVAGFPLRSRPPGQAGTMDAEPVADFVVTAEGNDLPYAKQAVTWEGRTESWAVWQLSFQRGQPMDVTVRYRLQVWPYGKDTGSDLYLGYILRTGRYWAGTIGQAEAVLSVQRPLRREDVRPETTPGWSLQDGTLRWQWRNLEPDSDLQVQMANTFWLDLPAELTALLDKPTLPRETLLAVSNAVAGLYTGGTRDSIWTPVRGGKLSGEAAEALLPRLLAAYRVAIARDPRDWELRRSYLWLLNASLWRYTQPGYKIELLSPARLRTAVAELQRFEHDTGLTTGPNPNDTEGFWRRSLASNTYLATADQELRKLSLAFLLEAMPATFPSAGAAEQWVRQGLGEDQMQLQPDLTALRVDLQQLAAQRVQPAAETPAAPPTTAPPAATRGLPPAVQSAPRPARTTRRWLWPALGAVAVLTAVGLWWWQRQGKLRSGAN